MSNRRRAEPEGEEAKIREHAKRLRRKAKLEVIDLRDGEDQKSAARVLRRAPSRRAQRLAPTGPYFGGLDRVRPKRAASGIHGFPCNGNVPLPPSPSSAPPLPLPPRVKVEKVDISGGGDDDEERKHAVVQWHRPREAVEEEPVTVESMTHFLYSLVTIKQQCYRDLVSDCLVPLVGMDPQLMAGTLADKSSAELMRSGYFRPGCAYIVKELTARIRVCTALSEFANWTIHGLQIPYHDMVAECKWVMAGVDLFRAYCLPSFGDRCLTPECIMPIKFADLTRAMLNMRRCPGNRHAQYVTVNQCEHQHSLRAIFSRSVQTKIEREG